MKKVVISSGSKQFIVTEGQLLEVELLANPGKTVTFEALLVIDGETTTIGTPLVSGVKVTAEVLEEDVKADKVYGVRFKAKKRVKTSLNHRQHHTTLKVTKIA